MQGERERERELLPATAVTSYTRLTLKDASSESNPDGRLQTGRRTNLPPTLLDPWLAYRRLGARSNVSTTSSGYVPTSTQRDKFASMVSGGFPEATRKAQVVELRDLVLNQHVEKVD